MKITFGAIKQKICGLVSGMFANKTGLNARRSLWDDVRSLISDDNPVIIDGGCNEGCLVELYLKQYRNPKIYAFEANPDLAKKLSDKFSGKNNVKVIAKALGSNRGSANFNISNNVNSSSLCERGEANIHYHGKVTEVANTISVPVVRLDEELADEKTIDVLKLDIEGYELEALKGSGKLLPNTKIIVSEIEFTEMYKNAPRFSEIETFLRNRGFDFLNFYDMYTHHDLQLTLCDAVFLNRKCFKKHGSK